MATKPCSQGRRRGRSALAGLLAVLGLAFPGVGRGEAPAPLSVLLITADDMGPQLGVYGDPVARTPRLDRLAREGVWFSDAYATQSSCSASRSSILTGLYPHQNGQVGLTEDYAMHPGVRTLPALLAEAGYRTGIIGKLHVSPDRLFPFELAHLDPRATRQVARVAEQVEAFLSEVDGASYFLMVNFLDPHRPFLDQVDGVPGKPLRPGEVPVFPWLGIDTERLRREVAGYYNGVARVDAGTGLVLDAVARAGRRDDTVVIFLGDHGPDFSRAKTTSYEAGVRIPFIVRWPGRTAEMPNPALVSTVDVLPTALAAAGRSAPEDVEGRSLLPFLRGETPAWRDALFTEYTAHRKSHLYPRRSIRVGSHKLIVNLAAGRPNPLAGPNVGDLRRPEFAGTPARHAFERAMNPPREELYDLARDPSEWRNLAGDAEKAALLDGLRERLREWQIRTADPLAPQTWEGEEVGPALPAPGAAPPEIPDS